MYMYVVKWKYLRRQCYRRAICNDNFKLNKLPQQIVLKIFHKASVTPEMHAAGCMHGVQYCMSLVIFVYKNPTNILFYVHGEV